MPSTPPAGSTLLTDLPEREAWKVLRESALPFYRSRLEGISEVAAVTVGVKQSEGRIVEPREPVLLVHVYRKGSVFDVTEIEPWHTISTPDHGRVAFRTDVADVGFAATGANLVPSPHLDASSDGSACCLLTSDGVDYLLSAAHVLDGPSPQLRVSWVKAGLVGTGDFVTRPGTFWFRRQDSTNGASGVVDAGLVHVLDPGIYANWNLVPWGDALVPRDEVDEVDFALVCGAHTRRVGVRYRGWLPTGFPVTEGSWRTHAYWRVALFLFTDPRGTTTFGDSGSPVFSSDGRLVGMHLGTHWSQGQLYSMVLSIADVLDVYRYLMGPGVQVRLPAAS